MGIFSDNFYSWLDREHAAEKAAMDAAPFKEEEHPRGGSKNKGQFKEKPETAEKIDLVSSADAPKKKIGYRQLRDAMAKKVKADGTYDLETGQPITPDDRKHGYQVSFQEETTERHGHGAYITDEEYDRKVDAISAELGGARPELGRFGEPEISFHVEDKTKALEIARRHNQESIWDWEAMDTIANKDFVGEKHYSDRDNHQGKKYHGHTPNPNGQPNQTP